MSIKPRCQPSLRYKNLILAGARFHNLEASYQESLSRIVPYECQGPQAERAKRLFRVFNLPLEWIFTRIIGVNKGKQGRDEQVQPPFWMAQLFDWAYRVSNWGHDWVLVPGLGVSGQCLEEGQMTAMREKIERLLEEEKEGRTRIKVGEEMMGKTEE